MWGQPRGGSIPLARTIIFLPGNRVIDVIGLTEGSTKWELILASGSPRRRELLSEAGLSFQIISPDVDELSGDGYSPRDLALTNARLKCMAVSVARPESMVIGADTVVTLGGKIYGKPLDLKEAAQNLRIFSGRIHEVLTGVVLSCGDQRAEFVSTSFVKFKELNELDIEDYLSKVYVLDKAGGYAAQEHRELIIEKFEGDYQNNGNPYVQPDVEIKPGESGNWTPSLTGSYLPRLRINDEYKDLLSSSGDDRKTRNYLRNQIRDGRAVIRAIDQRQETILAIAREIVDRQKPFLEKGSRHLKPMTMNEIAEVIGVHPTTVSRAVAGKYIDTPHGLMEMRKFFATGYQTSDGKDVSNEGVREALQELITSEDRSKPLSDSKLEKLLNEQGIKVARRTVAKYREQLSILPSHLRKKY